MTATTARPQHLQPELADYADDRRFAGPVTPYRRGFEDCLYERVFANPYAPGTAAASEYLRGNGDARLSQLQERTVLRVDETAVLDRLLAQRGLSAEIERVSLATGRVVRRFAIGAAGNPGGPDA